MPTFSTRAAAALFGFWLLAGVSPVAFSQKAPSEAAEEPLVFGFLPVVSPEWLVARFEPLVDHLSKALGVPVRMETAPEFAVFVRRTNEERRFDFLFTAPHFCGSSTLQVESGMDEQRQRTDRP